MWWWLCLALAAFEDFELGVADEEGIAAANGLEPVEAVAELGNVGEEVALDDLFDGGNVGVLIEDGGGRGFGGFGGGG